VGALSVVLYASEMEPGARLDALSLLMKGERLPSRTSWAGIPAACRRLSPVHGPNPSDARTADLAA